MNCNQGLWLPAPRVTPPLDPEFRPAVLANHAYLTKASERNCGLALRVALEQADGNVSHFSTRIPEDGLGSDSAFYYLERVCKFLLWCF